MSEHNTVAERPRRLAIIGAGSSGLITLKYALEALPTWEIVCFERSGRTIGCWGNPYPGFISTSTKYTTQFACFAKFDATSDPAGAHGSRAEFFLSDEYGQYLTQFAEHFGLLPHIRLHTRVTSIRRRGEAGGWEVDIVPANGVALHEHAAAPSTEQFDALVICTGLAAEPKPLECDVPTIPLAELHHPDGCLGGLRNRRIVVVGGGESGVEFARRLAEPELGNEVYLSLHSGVRVSPRYHPIRGVPSDFLRNRFMLSIHPAMRNWIGQRFVAARIRYEEWFQRFFPASREQRGAPREAAEAKRLRKQWAWRLTQAAKDDLFNMFHNKSDDFLDAVAQQRVTIIGPPLDRTFRTFRRFSSEETVEAPPELVVPAVGYRSTFPNLFEEPLALQEFYLGCCHVRYHDLFAVGFARPVIGNIPTISEMQARWVCGLIAGNFARPADVANLNEREKQRRAVRFSKLNTEAIYPVEMFPYCDQLARHMHCFPTLRRAGSLRCWCQQQLGPATTMHYFPEYRAGASRRRYMPATLVALLVMLLPVSWLVGWFDRDSQP